MAFVAFAAAPAKPIFAHAILMSSTPAIAGHVAAGKVAISLRYNSLIDVRRSRVTLTGPDLQPVVLPISGGPGGDGIDTMATLRAGHNSLRWQVLAIDGHITRGDVPFDVTVSAAVSGR